MIDHYVNESLFDGHWRRVHTTMIRTKFEPDNVPFQSGQRAALDLGDEKVPWNPMAFMYATTLEIRVTTLLDATIG